MSGGTDTQAPKILDLPIGLNEVISSPRTCTTGSSTRSR